jgi:hypothetical protein
LTGIKRRDRKRLSRRPGGRAILFGRVSWLTASSLAGPTLDAKGGGDAAMEEIVLSSEAMEISV